MSRRDHVVRRTDDNQRTIIAALRAVGASVQSLVSVGNGVPDLLVGYRRLLYLLEVKNPEQDANKQRLTPLEASWHSTWAGPPVTVVRTVDEALAAIGAPVGSLRSAGRERRR